MGNWTEKVALEPILFDGDTINITVKRLLIADMGAFMAHYNEGKLTFASHLEVARLAADIIPKYVLELSGMTHPDGTPFTISEFAEVAKEFYFAELVGAVLTGLMNVSSVSKADAKNSPPPSPV